MMNQKKTISPPPATKFGHLQPSDYMGAGCVLMCSGMTIISIILSAQSHALVWLTGQIILAVALLQWFILLHEAGHGTLFHSKTLNLLTGHVASFFSIIPFYSWGIVHNKHHIWTGWQDRDATTASLVPREMGRVEKSAMNFCWKFWIPVFSMIYKFQNFWNVYRLQNYVFVPQQRKRIAVNAFCLILVYGIFGYWVGADKLLRLTGLGLFLSLIFQETLLLSQHTHIPLNLSDGVKVQPYTPFEQEKFTRSLVFPEWFSKWILFSFDFHELHHMYAQIPGYHLNKIKYQTQNEVNWYPWIMKTRQIPGEVFLFQNRDKSGLNL